MAKYYWKKYEAKKTFVGKIIEREVEHENDFIKTGYELQPKINEKGRLVANGNPKNIIEFKLYVYAYYEIDGIWYKGFTWGDEPSTYFLRYYMLVVEGSMKDSQGSFIEEIIADENAYTNNARNSDGYWYVRDRIANIFYNQNKPINKFYSQNKLLKVRQQDKEW